MEGAVGDTRTALIAGAVEELSSVGQAEFTMEGVARRAFFSVGSVYNYWPDRSSLLCDLARECVAVEMAAALDQVSGAAQVITWALDEGHTTLSVAAELLLAGHADEAIAEQALQLWSVLLNGMSRHLPPAMAWYVATYAIGNALLVTLGVSGPTPARGRAEWLQDACEVERLDLQRMPSTPASSAAIEVPVVPRPERDDPTTMALIQAAKSLLTQTGAEGTSTRSIATVAGVTTGAVYRRYEAKSQLFADVLLVELSPDRYSWTWDLVRALSGDDPYGGAAEVMTRQLFARNEDLASQRVLLQIGVAARNDPALRDQVHQRIEIADRARRDMFEHFTDVGLMREDVDPAVLAWGFQTIPVGVRVMLPLGIALDQSLVSTAMRSILTATLPR